MELNPVLEPIEEIVKSRRRLRPRQILLEVKEQTVEAEPEEIEEEVEEESVAPAPEKVSIG